MPLKPAGTYAAIAAFRASIVPPTPDRVQHYKDMEDMIRLMLIDVTVNPKGEPPLTAPSGGGPVTGSGILT